ncbi:Septin-domain-containing protein [Helicostylum pulchrum]|nr:Septin-domain-containing protein [Helicostylum pulchrum]
MEESSRLYQSGSIRSSSSSSNSRRKQCDRSDSWVVPKVKTLSQQKSSQFRMIVCGDSGIGKSALVQTLAGLEDLPENNNESPFQPIEVFVPDTDICIVDTIGYGALIRADVIFSNVKSYIEQQFEKTSSVFNADYTKKDNLRYMVYQSSDILSHVDACLYVIMGRLKPIDIEYMRSIHDLVNIIPVIIQADLTLRPEERIAQRLDIVNMLKANEIDISFVGYESYQDILNCCKDPLNHPLCPPFMLDCTNNNSAGNKKKSFHGLLGLKQALYQHQYKYLKSNTTEKFINWRSNNHVSSSSTTTTPSSSQEQVKSNIRISQYITKRRHSIEREMLLQEKNLINELETSNKQKRTELILEQLNLLLKQDFDIQPTTTTTAAAAAAYTPVTHHFWICLSIVLSIFICYQNGSSLITKCMQSQWAKNE